MPFSGMINLRFLKVCRMKSIKIIKVFLPFFLGFLLFEKKKGSMIQEIPTVRNEKERKEKKEKEKGKGKYID